MLTAKINGIEYEMLRDFEITEQNGNKTSTTIMVEVGSSQPVPVAGDIIEISDEENILFWGTCGIPTSPKYTTGLEKHIYTIICGNANSILSNRIINVAYQGYTVSQIISSLYENYISSENIILGAVSTIDVTIDIYTAKDYNLQTALNELADLVGASWRISNDKKFYFVAVDDFPQFSHVVDENYLGIAELQHTTRDYKTRTVQYISGATETTSLQTETFTFNGSTKTFTTEFPLIAKPSIQVNGVAVSSSTIGVAGFDSEDENIQWLFSYNSQNIQYKGSDLNEGDVVTIQYYGTFSIRVASYNQNKITEIANLTGTSGYREQVLIANDISSMADAVQKANSLLAQFEESSQEIKFWISSNQLYQLGLTLDDVNILTKMTFNLPNINISGDYVIVERTLTPLYADMSNFEQKLKVSLRLVNRDYLKSYAEIISDLKRDISQLSFREGEIVVQSTNINDIISFGENLSADTQIAGYCTNNVINGSVMAPLSFTGIWYPGP